MLLFTPAFESMSPIFKLVQGPEEEKYSKNKNWISTKTPRFSAQPVAFDKLYLFSFAWSTARILHALSFPERVNAQHPFELAAALAAAGVILFPNVVWIFFLMLCFSVSNTLGWMPYEPNHLTLELITNVGILLALTGALVRNYRPGGPRLALDSPLARGLLLDSFAPFVRINLLVLYFFAVVHKLNWDFFNVGISCSSVLMQGFAQRFPFLPQSASAHWAAVWGTLVVEASIPIFLCFRRTRPAAILLGVGFHYFLSVHPHAGLYSFSALLFALYTLFVPADFPGKVLQLAQALFGRAQQRAAFALRAVTFTAAVGLIALATQGHARLWMGFLLWLGWGLLLAVTYVLVLSKNKFRFESRAALFGVWPAAFYLVPVLVAFNGLSPYLGLKTENSFSMFSNLRTEGGVSNHLFLAHVPQLFDYQHDLVDIVDTDLSDYKGFIANNQLVTYFEFQRIAARAKRDFYVKFIRNHRLQTMRVAHGVSSQPELTTPHFWLADKLLHFRPVDKGPCLCKH